MRPTRVLAVAVLGLAAALVGPAAATTKPAPLVLRGDTVITADRTSQADLVLLDDALVRVTDGDGANYGMPTPDVSVTGGGRLVSFDLQGPDQLSAVRYLKDGRSVLETGARGTFYPQADGCPPVVAGVGYCDGSTPGYTTALIHQGHYRLRVLTDGAPVTIRLHLHGVPGSARYRTRTPLAGAVAAVPVLSLTSPQYQRFETTLALPSAADVLLNVDATWSRSPLAAGVVWCGYVPTRPELPTDYASYCPAGQQIGTSSYPFLNVARVDYDPNTMFGLMTSTLPAGSHRVGFSATDDGGVTVRSALVGWMAQ